MRQELNGVNHHEKHDGDPPENCQRFGMSSFLCHIGLSDEPF